jgi:hypothetical protein
VTELLIPCILHLEMRISEKLLTLLTQEIYNENGGGEVSKGRHAALERVINEVALAGVSAVPTSFKINVTKNIVETISLSNVRLVRIMEHRDQVVSAVFAGSQPERAAKWLQLLERYHSLMAQLKTDEDFEDIDTHRLQFEIDKFIKLYIDMHGQNNVTNYIHILAAGHLRYADTHTHTLVHTHAPGFDTHLE